MTRLASRSYLSFLRARSVGTSLAVIAAVSAVSLLAGENLIDLRVGSGAGVPYATLAPAMSGSLIAASARSGLFRQEQLASRNLWGPRAALLLGMVLWAAAWAAIAQPTLPHSPGDVAAVRNVVGFTGLGLIASRIVGGRLAWIAPISMAIAALTLASSSGQSRGAALVWPLTADGNVTAALVALTIFAVGAGVVIAQGTRERETDAEE